MRRPATPSMPGWRPLRWRQPWAKLPGRSAAAAFGGRGSRHLSAAPRSRAASSMRPAGQALAESANQPGEWDLALIVADGLSALAVERHAPPLLTELLPRLKGWRWRRCASWSRAASPSAMRSARRWARKSPWCSSASAPGSVRRTRWARISPGHPRPGRTDAERNCISNIRAEGPQLCAGRRSTGLLSHPGAPPASLPA